MPKVSAKQVQRRIAELDAQYTVAQSKRPGRTVRRTLAVIIVGLIAVAAFSYAHRTTSDFVELTLKQGTTTPKPQVSEEEAQAKWNAVLGAASAGLKSGE
jgi:hypothetical protein